MLEYNSACCDRVVLPIIFDNYFMESEVIEEEWGSMASWFDVNMNHRRYSYLLDISFSWSMEQHASTQRSLVLKFLIEWFMVQMG